MKLKITLISLLVLLTLVSCTSTGRVGVINDEQATEIECSGMFSSWQNCYEKISQICGAFGYEIVKSNLDGQIIRGSENAIRKITATCKK